MYMSRSNSIGMALTVTLACNVSALAQTKQPLRDLAWMRDYAVPYAEGNPSLASAAEHTRLDGAPQFLPTLQAAFPQHQWFWRDHGRFWSVAELAQDFLSVTYASASMGGNAWIDHNRFVTLAGCAPHNCGPDGANGLLWADTSTGGGQLIFAASMLSRLDQEPSMHLWLFTSHALNFQKMPPAFLFSLQRWMNGRNVPKANGFFLVTIVQPTGEQVEVGIKTLQAAQQMGTKQ
jgi:hypothetical protein